VQSGTVRTPQAYEVLFREIGPSLWRAVFVYAGGRHEVADDAVAEAFARALEHDQAIRDPKPWLYRTAFRVALSEMRRRDQPGDPAEHAATSEPQGLGELVAALRALSPSQRAAIVLHYEEDLLVKEVARVMGSTSGAVRVHLHNGRRRLRTLLGAEEVPDD
jgi:RNA polymerase sigma-70 factor (ECF subfamily)